MNELAQEIQQFEEGTSQLVTALRQTEQLLSTCRALEEMLLQAIDFLALLDIETLTQEQRGQRHHILIKADLLLSHG